MITLRKNNITMEVWSEVQASVFERNGYVRVEKPEEKPMVEAQTETVVVEEAPKPKRRRRKAVEEITPASIE